MDADWFNPADWRHAPPGVAQSDDGWQRLQAVVTRPVPPLATAAEHLTVGSERTWLSLGLAGGHEFLVSGLPAGDALRDPANRLVIAVVDMPIQATTGDTLPLTLLACGRPGDVADSESRSSFQQMMVDYLGERVGHATFDLITNNWRPGSDGWEDTASVIDGLTESAHTVLVGGPVESMLSAGLKLPASLADEGAAFAQFAVPLPGAEIVGHLTRGLRIASVVSCALAGHGVLAAASFKTLLRDVFTSVMTRGLDGAPDDLTRVRGRSRRPPISEGKTDARDPTPAGPPSGSRRRPVTEGQVTDNRPDPNGPAGSRPAPVSEPETDARDYTPAGPPSRSRQRPVTEDELTNRDAPAGFERERVDDDHGPAASSRGRDSISPPSRDLWDD
jgi:hypothetical protein